MIPIIHAVTTDEIVARADFRGRAIGVMRALGPRGAVQLRAPRTSGRRLYDIARALAEEQESTGAWLVVTDRVDVAVAVRARGVQLTSRSIGVVDALAVGPTLAIGASAHSLVEAQAGAQAGASWLVVGKLTGSGRGVSGPRALKQLCADVPVPVVIIGGVTPAHVAPLRELGARGVAAIRGIWDAESATDAAGSYLAAYDGKGDPVP